MLSEYSKEFNIVLNQPLFIAKFKYFDLVFHKLLSYFSSNGFMYYACLHDRDTKEDGTLKEIHYHLVLVSLKRFRLSTMLNKICAVLTSALRDYDIEFDFPVFCVSIDKVYDLALSIQYLIHKNDKDKFQYDDRDIFSNVPQTINEYMNVNHYNFDDISCIIDLCKRYPFELDLIAAIGTKKYLYYKRIFDLVRQDMFKYNEYGQCRLESAKNISKKVRKG